MELLIPGLALVALMVWASTRIKKNAAAAFDAETVETDEFTIRKPEGFLHVLNDESGLAFRSYSKEFGKIGDREVRRATIEIVLHSGIDLDRLKAKIQSNAESTSYLETYLDGGEKAAWMNTTQILGGGEYDVSHKLITRGADVWEARGSVLADYRDGLLESLETALDSVRVK
jgi:hypothetical protein